MNRARVEEIAAAVGDLLKKQEVKLFLCKHSHIIFL